MTEDLGRYEILEEIGQGGFAIVYRARDRQLDRQVALKELKPIRLADPSLVKDFRQEARNIARLDHPNVVTVYDIYEAEHRQFIVMQLVDGSSLEERLARQGHLSWSETVEIMSALAAGLDYAHSQNILHRDLKPANILLNSNHGPMLSDFGLAKLIGQADASLTAGRGVVGTSHYIAPEVWDGQGATRQSDIYALGCILYEMLIGQKLFPGETPSAVMMAHFSELSLPHTWPEDVPSGVADVLATALAQKPADRYATAGEMTQAFAALTTKVKNEFTTSQLGPARSGTKPVASPILTTKLYAPPIRPEFVPRPRLIERLNEGLRQSQGFGRKLTLISAPAGFGKTTLISDWLQQSQVPAAWLSLDEGDNDPTRFLVYLVAALQTVPATEGPNIGEGVLAVLQSSQSPPIESILTALLNEIATIPNNFALVLDDYHVIEAKPIDKALTFLLDHLPTQMHLVITTREDPLLPLARYRVRGQLTELRAADLRFSPAEATRFFNQMMGLNLSIEEIAALETRTEGWIAGLQMAALALQRPPATQQRADTATFISDFIAAFTGSHRFVLDYLVEEVLQRQPERVRNFLLQTSILDRLSGPLCDAVCSIETASSARPAVTGQEDGREMLETLDRGNLFVVPLDDQRRWYRYHHLFADVLQTHLMKEQPDQSPNLHRQASEWYEQNDLPADAIRHALAAEDFERAAALVELAWPAIFKGFQPATWLGWVKALPDELVRARPVLSVGYAWTLLDGGELEAAEARLRDAERWLNTTADMNERAEASAPEIDVAEMVVVNKEEFRSLPATIAIGRAYLARAHGDASATVKNARRALDRLPEEDHYWRGIAAMFLGLAYRTSGDLEAACQSLVDSVASLQRASHIHFQIVGTVALADIRMAQGRLHEAANTYQQALLQLTTAQGGPILQGTVDLYVGLSELHREWNNLEAARQYLLSGKEMEDQAVLPGREYRLYAATARIKEAQGDLNGALELLYEAERLYKRDPVPDVRPIAALKTRLWIEQGRLTEALGWVRERGLSANDELSYLREFEHITLVRVFIAKYKSDGGERSIQEAMGLLDRLLKAAEAGGRVGSLIEILVLQALAHQAQGNTPLALVSLERALTLAEPEGYIRIFVDEGQPVQTLLAETLTRGADPVYISQLLATINQQMGDETAVLDPNQLLIEPLSKRELEVLGLLALGHTNQAVADELIIAISTVKKHVNSIFGKLGVGSRTQAVSRARDLDLL